jgi:mono/diheme cytochrome c family protein
MPVLSPLPLRSTIACVYFALLLVSGQTTASAAERGEQFFEERVRPLLVARCVECHGPKKQEGGLRLDARQFALQGGENGAAIIPGKPEAGLLLKAIRRQDGLEMPPEEPLTEDEVAILERWLKIGAPWPQSDTMPKPALGDQSAIRDVASSHWAFRPIVKPAVPESDQPNAIDAFVHAKLNTVGMSPAEPAERRVLIRRAYIDTIGLPPSPEQVDAFVNDHSPRAFENVVDELLASPHFGERWARHWLDVARYADTRDWRAQTDVRYPFAYTYRDWVIKSLNADLPYDEFLRQQIAADFYSDSEDDPSLAALGFLTIGSRFRNSQLDITADQIDVVTRGLMALTVTCARCHDHKYDPVPTEDYYSLYGVFASTDIPEDFPQIAVSQPIDEQVRADYEKQRAAAIAERDKYADELIREALADLRKKLKTYFDGYYELSVTRKTQIRGIISKLKVKETAMTPLAANLDRIVRVPRSAAHPVFGLLAAGLSLKEEQFKQQVGKLPELAANPKFNKVVTAALVEADPKSRRDLLDAYATLFDETLKQWAKLKRDQPDAKQLPDADREEIRRSLLSANNGLFQFSRDQVLQASRLLGAGRRKIGDLEKAIREVDVSHPGSPPRAMVVADKPQPITPAVFLRGEPQRRGDRVPRQFLEILTGDDRKPFEEGSGRRELAEAVTDPSNPLTARVAINRIWMHYFGAGLVRTPGDFGLRSDPPSHPELLDWLAATFMTDDAWSLKTLHRRILLSATYQQSSFNEHDYSQVDPDNRLLWRANRKRLDFESMRDAMLAASGQIDLTVGGRSVPLSAEPFTARRTLYGYIDRVDLDPLFKTFDFPSPDVSAPERTTTTVPQQALFAMNHPFVVEQSRALISDVAKSAGDDSEQRVQVIYRRLFGRVADAQEVSLARAFIDGAAAPQTPQDSVWQYGYGSGLTSSAISAFTPMAHWTGKEYQPVADWPTAFPLGHVRVTAVGGHPGRNADHSVIRRWVSPVDGVVTVHGKLKHLRDGGDGIHARVIVNSQSVAAEWNILTEEVETTAGAINVRRGDTIDFAVDCKANAASDAFAWSPEIRLVDTDTAWNARRDFAAPPPPPMTGWEQLAQALLLTNEFLYVD